MPGRLLTDQIEPTVPVERREVLEAVEARLQATVPGGVSIRMLRGEASDRYPTIASKVTDTNRDAVLEAYKTSAGSRPHCYRASRNHGYVYIVDEDEEGEPIIDDAAYNGGVPVRI